MFISSIKELFRKIFGLVKKLWAIPFLRFLVVGGMNTLFLYMVFAIFTLLHFHYVVATLIAYICGTLFNFRTYGTLVFRNKSFWLIFRFVGVAVLLYGLNIGILKIFEIFDVNKLVAQAILTLPLAGVSFFLFRKFVFRTIQKKQFDKATTP